MTPRANMAIAATSRRRLNIVEAMDHPGLFGPYFRGASWSGWKAVLKAAHALPMSDQECAFFRTIAERDPPKKPARERIYIAGRGAGKDSIESLDIGHTAVTFDRQDKLRPGERATVMCLAVDREQSQIILGYVRAYFSEIAPLKAMVVRETADGLELNNGVDIVIATNSYRSIRGRSLLHVCMDEAAFWKDEFSSSPDIETYNAAKPGLRLPGSTLTIISTPYRRSGLLYGKFAKHYGRDDDDVLVIKAPSITLNPTLDQSIINQALEDDPSANASEWLAEWRDDLSSYISRALIEAAIEPGVTVRPYDRKYHYTSFIDPSSGQRDSFCCAVAHKEAGDLAVLDCLVEVKAPFDTNVAVAQIADVLKSYHLTSTSGDDHAKGWVVAELQRHRIGFEPRPSKMDRSALYQETLPLYSAGRVKLLDVPRLVSQYTALERRLMPGGWSRIDHPNRTGYHDDLANVTAGALWRATAVPPSVCELCTPEIVARIQAMPRNPRYAQRCVTRIQHRFADRYASQLGERAFAKLRGY
jgi:hypothetical protein